jgi:hypothetical protein
VESFHIKRLALCADVLTAEEMTNRVEFLKLRKWRRRMLPDEERSAIVSIQAASAFDSFGFTGSRKKRAKKTRMAAAARAGNAQILSQ